MLEPCVSDGFWADGYEVVSLPQRVERQHFEKRMRGNANIIQGEYEN